jgi:hypothetical protein
VSRAALVLTLVLSASPAFAQSFLPQATAAAPVSSKPPQTTDDTERMSIRGFIWGSVKLLAVEHAVRIAFQPKTRAELGGPFWSDYIRSVKAPKAWEDGDPWIVNYVGHPIHGAAAGFIWIEQDPTSRKPQIGLGLDYWKTRARPVIASALYSIQFEIGPLSEASIGNVGMHPNTIGWVDYVVTPVGGMAMLVAEDALDLFFVRWVEQHTTNRVWRACVRMIFGPARLMANLALGRAPWSRDARPLDWR